MTNDIQYLTVKEVAEKLRVSEESIRNYIEKGIIKAIRIGKVYRIPEPSFNQYMTSSEVSPSNMVGGTNKI